MWLGAFYASTSGRVPVLLHYVPRKQCAVRGCHAEAAASRQNFAEQLQELQQEAQAATDACPTAEQYNQVPARLHLSDLLSPEGLVLVFPATFSTGACLVNKRQ